MEIKFQRAQNKGESLKAAFIRFVKEHVILKESTQTQQMETNKNNIGKFICQQFYFSPHIIPIFLDKCGV